MIGIATSLFCSLTITRAILDFKLSKRDSNKLSIGKGIRAINEVNLSIIPKSKLFISISLVFIAISLGSVLVKGFDFSIDFMGGQVYTVQYDDNLRHEEDLTQILKTAGLSNAKVRHLGGTSANSYQISVKDLNDQSGTHFIIERTTKSVIVASDTVGPTIGKELRFNAILLPIILVSHLSLCLVRFGKMGLGLCRRSCWSYSDTIIIGFISLMDYL